VIISFLFIAMYLAFELITSHGCVFVPDYSDTKEMCWNCVVNVFILNTAVHEPQSNRATEKSNRYINYSINQKGE
jgi:hypothetical protein